MSYKKLSPAHATRTVRFNDGSTKNQYSRYETGVIAGKYRDIPALIADETGFDGLGFNTHIGSPDDNWHAINLFDSSHKYVETVAVAGAMDADHAVTLAVSQFDHLGEKGVDYGVLVANDTEFDGFDGLGWSSDTLGKLMNNPNQDSHYLPIVTKKALLAEQSRVTADTVMWDGIALQSHGGDTTRLFLDIQKNDAFGELTAKFDMAQALAGMKIEELGFDALMETNNRLDMMKERIFTAMSKTSIDGLSVTNATLTEPFKRQGVANVAMQFDLSDGQAIVIWFHNPDADPKKLAAGDMMVSWKWMLNKRDITAAVSPKNGENVQVPQLAMRMMKVAAKNSKRFAAAQAKKAENAQALADAQKAVDDKTATLVQLDKDIADLNSQIEGASKVVVEAPVEPVANADVSTEIQQNDPTPTAIKPKWYESQPDNVSVYLIGKSKGNDYLKVTNNGNTITALINIGGVGGEYEGDRVGLANWIKSRTQQMGGGSYDLKLVAGEDILANANEQAAIEQEMTKTTQEIGAQVANLLNKPDSNAKNSDFTSELEIFFERLSDEEESDDSMVLFDENRTAEEQGLSPIFDNKTVAFIKALKTLNDIAIAKKYQIQFGDFSQTANASLFDSMGVEGSYGITAQLMDSKGNVARAEIDEYGRIMILTGAGGTDSPHKKPLAYSSKKAIADNLEKAFAISSKKQAEPVATVAEPEPSIEPITEPVKPTIDSGNNPSVLAEGTPDEMHFIGENSEGIPIYEGKDGLRHLSKFGGILMQAEPKTLTDKGMVVESRSNEFMTTQELANKDNNVADQANQSHPNYTQEDIDYLNAIINGDIDPLDVDMDKIIAIGEKDETDPLFEQALQLINDAEDKATAGV